MDLEGVLREAKRVIDGGLKHRDYDRVTELADQYYKYATGDLEGKLIQYIGREFLPEFELRKALTNSITPAVWKSITIPFYKVSRTDAVCRAL